MKKIFPMLILAGMLPILSACKDWLDIRPESEVVLDDFWQTESDVMQVLAACYQSLTETDFMDRVILWGEVRSDNVTSLVIDGDFYRFLNFDISASNSVSKWGDFYKTINFCNTFLHFAPDVVDKDVNFNSSKLRSLSAEVLTIRALAYFYLVRAFKDVPYTETPAIDDAQDYRIPKSSEDEILDKLEEDLKYALRYARDRFETQQHTKGRITKNAVLALLADIYLWRGKYAECIEAANEVINSPELSLVAGRNVLTNVFHTGNSQESIFELQFDTNLRNNIVVLAYYGGDGGRLGVLQFPTYLYSKTATSRIFDLQIAGSVRESFDDIRRKDFLFPLGGEMIYVFKYVGSRLEDPNSEISRYYFRNTSANWIFYRLSEVILMKAEALIQLGESHFEEALEMINITYLRSNFQEEQTPLAIENYASRGDLESLLMRERQRELMFEGKRWFDLVRKAKRENDPLPLLMTIAQKLPSLSINRYNNMDALYLPIHIDELRNNKELEQNPFYKLSDDSINW